MKKRTGCIGDPAVSRKVGKAARFMGVSAVLFLILTMAGVSNALAGYPPGQGSAESGTVSAPKASGLNAFSLELYSGLSSREGNLFFSPWSVLSSLALAYEGSGGKTRKDMARTLCFPLEGSSFRSSFSSLNQALSPLGQAEGLKVKDARSLWIDASYGFKKAYLSRAKRSLGASLHSADFRHDPERARARINAWVKGSTGGMIQELLEKGMTGPGTNLVIADALYFSGLWSLPFDEKETQDGVFHKAGGADVTVPMMHQQGRFRTLSPPGVSMIELPYGKDRVSMVILLPEKAGGLKELEKGLQLQNLDRWLNGLARAEAHEVVLALPRFSMACSLDLGDTLSAMGMGRVFTPEADFSGMTGGKGLFISLVIHKARVEVNEKGTEAAAATGVVMTKGIRVSSIFAADHPFVFLIRDQATGGILFMGRVVDPGAR
jgi:serpin B